ncbi:MAG: U32 family peptidase [Bacteroidales bacterium]|nr:U32 family peptidase [Bacteroidales bacterium]
MTSVRLNKLELLAPARTADIGIEAIRHGADAVYIGAERFGARQAAGNSVEDIARLVAYAHVFDARVYVTLNTLLYDDELAEVERLVKDLLAVGVDAFIVQDLAMVDIVRRCGGRWHASTQMDNRTVEQVQWLRDMGAEQVVLARELSLEEIRQVHEQCPDVSLEVFVHGALCVSLSGRCYASEALFRRSANRGACAQVCRMEFDLEDEKGHKLLEKKHLLSLKDLCQLDVLEELAEAGARSFKIEGRLKDMAYVKNVTAAYSEALDALCAKYPDRYRRNSCGEVQLKFRPDVRKSFNRGFTHYFLFGRNPDIFSFDTPKAVGVEVGRVEEIGKGSLVLEGDVKLENGDGLCFFNRAKKLIGFRVNRVEGSRVWPYPVPHDLLPGMVLYRNFDKAFNDILAKESATRTVPLDLTLDYDGEAFLLAADDGVRQVFIRKEYAAELARTHQSDNIQRQLSRLGDTPYRLRSLNILLKKNYFIPSSVLAEWRRELVGELSKSRGIAGLCPTNEKGMDKPCPSNPMNVSNSLARVFYEQQGCEVEPAFELQHRADVPVMTCRHCLRYAMGWCQKRGGAKGPKELFLSLENGARFRLAFDCQNCMMQLYLA